jgi:ABC-type spermidine/putrescine transport system permease subunit I
MARRVVGPRLRSRFPTVALPKYAEIYVFGALWAVAVLLPMLEVVVLSVLKAHGLRIQWAFSLHAYQDILETDRWKVVVRTLQVAATVTLFCLVTGFPFAVWLAKRARSPLLVQLIRISLTVPFFLDPSARTLVWRSILGSSGLINTLLLKLHLIDAPIEWLLFSDFAVYLGLVLPYFPNMVWPIYIAVLLIDDGLLEASADLGAGPGTTLRHVVIPLAMPGIIAGLIFTFVPILGDGVVPTLLGGGEKEYLADSVMSLSTTMSYAEAAAMATIVLGITVALLGLFWLFRRRIAVGQQAEAAA